MRVLITGANGLVGSRIAQHLSSSGHTLSLASRSKTLYTLDHCTNVQVDWNSQVSLDTACHGADVVIHACGVNAHDSVNNPLSAFLVNGVGSARLRLAASRAGVRRIIYFSTAHVYCNPLIGTLTEDSNTVNLHPYASSHLAGEGALFTPPNLSGPDVFVLRMSNAFGAPLHPDTNCWTLLASDLCRQAISTRSLSLNTPGIQRRDFIPLSHVCYIVEQLLTLTVPGPSYQVFNLGGSSCSVRQFAELIQAQASLLLGQHIPLYIPPSNPNTTHKELHFSCSKLAEHIKLPVPSFEPELNDLLAFCLEHFHVST